MTNASIRVVWSRRLFIASVVLSLGSLHWSSVIGQEKKSKDDSAKQQELEGRLLKLPANARDHARWQTLWRNHLQIAFRERLHEGRLEVHAIALVNRSPCRVEVVQNDGFRGLSVGGRGDQNQEWIAEPNGKLYLGIAPNLSVIALGQSGHGAVDTLIKGRLGRLRIIPQHTPGEPVELCVLYRMGMLGERVVHSAYYLCEPQNADRAFSEL